MKKIEFTLSRQNLYLLILSFILLIFVLIFSFVVLIPEGKQYREKRAQIKKQEAELNVQRDFNDETQETLKILLGRDKNIIAAFANTFDPIRFKKLHGKYFSSLEIMKSLEKPNEEDFSLYEVRTVSQINSPKAFYDFLDSLNKTEWIIAVNFPINFKRDGESISSSFTMRVYSNPDENNSTKR